MSSQFFKVIEHTIPCQHIREYPHATRDNQEEVLQLSVKQYIPLDNTNPKEGDVTIIGAHANGFPKELYEPLWDDLLQRSKTTGFAIRGIWIADAAHQGASGILNEEKLGNDPSWFDQPRDLLHLINTFRTEIRRPIVGIGHSMGGNAIVNLSLMHARLFETVILIDPVMQAAITKADNMRPAQASVFRRDIWPSREEAVEGFKRSEFYRRWDSRVLDCWIKHGLRDLPTALYPKSTKGTGSPLTAIVPSGPTLAVPPARPEVTLATTVDQEVATFLRSSARDDSSVGQPVTLYRPESVRTFTNLPFLQPSVLYIFGSESSLSNPEARASKMATTGTGMGGSGGAVKGRVKEIVLEGAGHLIPMEMTAKTADCVVNWMDGELMRWKANETVKWHDWLKTPVEQRSRLDDEYISALVKGSAAMETKLAKRRQKL